MSSALANDCLDRRWLLFREDVSDVVSSLTIFGDEARRTIAAGRMSAMLPVSSVGWIESMAEDPPGSE